KLMVDSGAITVTAFISPYKQDRDNVRQLFEEQEFIEVYTECSIETCEQRDPKGLYKKARTGEIPEFTGISAPYEPPEEPEIIINTEDNSVESSVNQILSYLKEHRYI
ncbi:MAG: adenylyl-sulfate kinase, partial [Staphylococcus warneri]|nr:adenylyl-sulfate kinase [Staphylococcus warneri]